MTRTARPPNPSPSTSTSTARAWRTPALIGGVLALAVIAGLLFALVLGREPATAAADPTPTASPIPTAPASPSEAPEPSEAPIPPESPSAPIEPPAEPEPESAYLEPVVANPDVVLPPGGVARVLVDGLRVRQQAMLDAPEVITLRKGQLVIVGPTFTYGAFGPVVADGYTWYYVSVLDANELPEPGGASLENVAVGAVAIGDGEDQWLELLDPRCTDAEPTLQHLSSLTEWERLACYGNRQITVEGVLGCGGCGGLRPGTFTPEWLAWPNNMDFLSVDPQTYIGPMPLNWSPDGPQRPDTSGPTAPILRVTGHFDDPAAQDCSHTFVTSTSGVEEALTIDPTISRLFCRSNFVVDSYEILGEYANFPYG